MELRAADGSLAGSTRAAEDGYYEFFFDATAEAPEERSSVTGDLLPETTNWARSLQLPPFDSELGTLVAVELTVTASITSAIEAESLDSEPAILTATVSGRVEATAGGLVAVALPEVQAGQFAAAAYDGTSDYDGPSGHDFGEHEATDSATATLDGDALGGFLGPAAVQVDAIASATSSTAGSGNVLNHIQTVAAVSVSLVYRYVPYTCLTGATYTIVEVDQPAGYGDGRETAGNVSPLPGSDSSDAIPLTVGGIDLPNNNFGELTGSLAGYVYVDLDDDGRFDPQEPPIPGVSVRLFGEAEPGDEVDLLVSTAGDGSYFFGGLVAGHYVLRESQPEAFLDGRDTIGSQGGAVANDEFTIDLGPGVRGVQNNYGERPAPTPTATARPASATPVTTGTPPPPSITVLTTGTPPPGATVATGTDQKPGFPPTPGVPGTGMGLGFADTGFGFFLAALVLSFGGAILAVLLVGERRRAGD